MTEKSKLKNNGLVFQKSITIIWKTEIPEEYSDEFFRICK